MIVPPTVSAFVELFVQDWFPPIANLVPLVVTAPEPLSIWMPTPVLPVALALRVIVLVPEPKVTPPVWVPAKWSSPIVMFPLAVGAIENVTLPHCAISLVQGTVVFPLQFEFVPVRLPAPLDATQSYVAACAEDMARSAAARQTRICHEKKTGGVMIVFSEVFMLLQRVSAGVAGELREMELSAMLILSLK